jgi:hypothetical protein
MTIGSASEPLPTRAPLSAHKVVPTHIPTPLVASVALALAVYVGMFIGGDFVLRDADTYWHIKIGQWILQHGELPRIDFYSYTEAGKPWIDTAWLSDVLYALTYEAGGWRAVALVADLIAAAVVGVLSHYLQQHLRFSVAIGLAAVSACTTFQHFLARPHLFSYLLLAVWLIALLNAFDKDKGALPKLYVTAPLMVLWANLHGSFTLGLLLLYIFAGFSLWRGWTERDLGRCWRVLANVAVVSVCALMTPYGATPFTMTSTLLGNSFITAHLDEWQSPNFQAHRHWVAYFLVIVMVMPVFGIQLRGPRLLVFLMLAVLALSYNRGLLTFLLLAPVVVAAPVAAAARYLGRQDQDTQHQDAQDQRAIDSNPPPPDPVVAFLARRPRSVLALCVAVFCAIQIVAGSRPIAPPDVMSPRNAIEYVRRTGITGNVFNEDEFGGFLIAEGVPTFIDGRAELFAKSDTLRNYFTIRQCLDLDGAFALFEQYKIAWVILAPDAPMAKALALQAQWDRVFVDKTAVVFVRRTV